MTYKVIILLLTIIYFLIPTSVKPVKVRCGCGCGESICHCCAKSQGPCDVTCMTKCESETADDSGTQFSAITSQLFKVEALYNASKVFSNDNNSPSLCYREPRVKPPPAVCI